MERLTKKLENQDAYVSEHIEEKYAEGFSGDAIEKLAKFENLFEHLMNEHESLPKELEDLRRTGKVKSYHFRETFGLKLTIEAFLRLMKDFDIE